MVLQNHIRFIQTLKGIFFSINFFFFFLDDILEGRNFALQIPDHLFFCIYNVLHLFFTLYVLFFIGVGHFIYEHFPFIFLAFFEELLVDTHDTNDDVFLGLSIAADILDYIVEAYCVDIQSPMQSRYLIVSQTMF